MSPRGRRGALRLDRRGAVAVLFACALPMLIAAVGVGIEFSRIAAARAALQRAVDNAALSGAAAYVLYTATDAFKAVAVSTANAAFCKTAAALPAGATLAASTGGAGCNGGPGPVITAAIGGHAPGTRGAAADTGCTATNTVVAGATCGFLVTVTAAVAVGPTFGGLLGGARTLTVSATALNPFLDLGKALSVNLGPTGAWNANSIWVYPLRLDANGKPDFAGDPGARPPTTGCTGAPDQTRCGNGIYVMLASTYYQALGCTQSTPCTTADGATFAGTGGIVQNPRVSGAVITATTPLGFAFESTSGGWASFGLDAYQSWPAYFASPPATGGCHWPAVTAYNTVTQVFPPTQTTRGSTTHLPPNNTPLSAALEGRNRNPDGSVSIDWTVTTKRFYSSFLANNRTPSDDQVRAQLSGIPQKVQSVSSANPPTTCTESRDMATTFPTSGASNCSLYIQMDPVLPAQPNPNYRGNKTCWTPSATPGRQYAALSCQGFAGHTFAFFWNDMGGSLHAGDDTDYGNGTTIVSCSGSTTTVRLID